MMMMMMKMIHHDHNILSHANLGGANLISGVLHHPCSNLEPPLEDKFYVKIVISENSHKAENTDFFASHFVLKHIL